MEAFLLIIIFLVFFILVGFVGFLVSIPLIWMLRKAKKNYDGVESRLLEKMKMIQQVTNGDLELNKSTNKDRAISWITEYIVKGIYKGRKIHCHGGLEVLYERGWRLYIYIDMEANVRLGKRFLIDYPRFGQNIILERSNWLTCKILYLGLGPFTKLDELEMLEKGDVEKSLDALYLVANRIEIDPRVKQGFNSR